MSDIGLDFTGLMAILSPLVITSITFAAAFVNFVRTPTLAELQGRPLRGERSFQHAVGAGISGLLSLAASLVVFWIEAGKVISSDALDACDEWTWLWIFPAAGIWWLTVSIVRRATRPGEAV